MRQEREHLSNMYPAVHPHELLGSAELVRVIALQLTRQVAVVASQNEPLWHEQLEAQMSDVENSTRAQFTKQLVELEFQV